VNLCKQFADALGKEQIVEGKKGVAYIKQARSVTIGRKWAKGSDAARWTGSALTTWRPLRRGWLVLTQKATLRHS
jgi:hypothetical protein